MNEPSSDDQKQLRIILALLIAAGLSLAVVTAGLLAMCANNFNLLEWME